MKKNGKSLVDSHSQCLCIFSRFEFSRPRLIKCHYQSSRDYQLHLSVRLYGTILPEIRYNNNYYQNTTSVKSFNTFAFDLRQKLSSNHIFNGKKRWFIFNYIQRYFELASVYQGYEYNRLKIFLKEFNLRQITDQVIAFDFDN